MNLSEQFTKARQLFDGGQLDAAEAILRAILKDDPDQSGAQTLLAVILVKTGRISEVVPLLESVLAFDPLDFDAVSWLAVAKKNTGNFEFAIELFERAAKIRPTDASVFNQLGLCWLALKQPIPAGAAFKQAIILEPRSGQGYHNLGMALKQGGSNYEAFHTFKRASEIDPNFIGNYVQLFKQVQQLLNWTESLPVLERGVRIHPNSAALSVALATNYGKVGQPARAELLYQEAAKVDATAGPPYAHWLQEEGRFEDSVVVLKQSVRLNPIQGLAYFNLATAKCFDVDGRSLIELSLEILKIPRLRAEAKMFLHYALAKSFEIRKDFESAIHHYDAANDLAYRAYNATESFSEEAVTAYIKSFKELFTPQLLDRVREAASPSEVPVFIVGMIRSGTTLLDQILSSHPQVRSAGEQPFWHLMADRTNREWKSDGPDLAEIELMATRYLKILGEAAGFGGTGDGDRIIDKMPPNYQHIGLIHAIFPHARFIHLRRSPMDTCVSIYTTYLGNATNFAYRKSNIVGTYRSYLQMMDLWRTLIPRDRLIEVDYEELVTDREPILRRLIEFMGLEWSDACLSHQENRGQVSTPSLFTARQPVHSGSVARWKNYAAWLGEFNVLQGVEHPRA